MPNYLNVLETINVLQGGVPGNVGQNNEPLEFVCGTNSYIRCNSVETFERLTGALKTQFIGCTIVRTNPTHIVVI